MQTKADKLVKYIDQIAAEKPLAKYSDCTTCDNGRKYASKNPWHSGQCQTGSNGKCRTCGRLLTWEV